MDRYLVQFREDAQEHFKTDCGFRDGQLDRARLYVLIVVDEIDHVQEGQVLDTRTQTCVFRYPQD